MEADTGGVMTLIMSFGSVILLGAGLAYGIWSSRRRSRNRAVERVRDRATNQVYDLAEEEEKRRTR